jgi:hypothetical protein
MTCGFGIRIVLRYEKLFLQVRCGGAHQLELASVWRRGAPMTVRYVARSGYCARL